MIQVRKAVFRDNWVSIVLVLVALGFAAGFVLELQSRSDRTRPSATASPATDDLEARARANPGDGEAWLALGTSRFDAGRFAEATTAFERATETAPDRALAWSSLGEARVMASERDPMPAAALAAFRKALSLDPKEPRARYFLAVSKDLAGDHGGAIADWLALLADTPPGAPWESDLRRTIEQVGKINRIDVAERMARVSRPAPQLQMAARGIPGPTTADLRAASAIPPGEQRQMAEGMVGRLEGKLKANPANPDGWVMLMRSRVTLGQPDKAAQALKDALSANPASSDYLRQQAQILGIK